MPPRPASKRTHPTIATKRATVTPAAAVTGAAGNVFLAPHRVPHGWAGTIGPICYLCVHEHCRGNSRAAPESEHLLAAGRAGGAADRDRPQPAGGRGRATGDHGCGARSPHRRPTG